MRLHYRHVDQAERWKQVDMQEDGESFTAAIPADYTQSDFPLEYYFDLAGKRRRHAAGTGIQCDAFEPAILRGDAAGAKFDKKRQECSANGRRAAKR